MRKKAQSLSKVPAAKPAPETPLARPKSPETCRWVGGRVLPAGVFSKAVAATFGESDDFSPFALDFIERMAPRDPAEELLIAQLLRSDPVGTQPNTGSDPQMR